MKLDDRDLGLMCEGMFGQKCTAQAFYAVVQHRVGHCNLGTNVVRLMCPKHTAMVLQANAFTEPYACRRCGKVFHELHDLISTEHLITGSSLDA